MCHYRSEYSPAIQSTEHKRFVFLMFFYLFFLNIFFYKIFAMDARIHL